MQGATKDKGFQMLKIKWILIVLIFPMAALGMVLLYPLSDLAHASKVETSDKLCFECHREQDIKKGGAIHRPVQDGKCIECHNPHASRYAGLLNLSSNKLCYNCHEKESGFSGTFVHKPVEEGGCLICHDPHSSKYTPLLIKAGGDICFGCHSKDDIAGKKYIHPEVKKGKCSTCHTPHSSERQGLLVKDIREVCIDCHTGRGGAFTSMHDGYNVVGTNCLSCHSPHSSDRNGLLKASLHKPFADKNCEACHRKKTLKTTSGSEELCMRCHEETRDSFNKIFSHLVRGNTGNPCSNCHSPHASDNEHLMKNKEKRVCFTCHADTAHRVVSGQHVHPELDACTDCHVAHASNEIALLVKGSETCSTCHETQGRFTHPVGVNIKDPRNKMAMDCVTCHNPMGSPEKYILRDKGGKELCEQCHQLK